jgi:hypothetical protein
MKICTKCVIEKELSEFSNDRTRKDGLYPHCKNCIKDYNLKNKDKIAIKDKEQRIKFPWKRVLRNIKKRCNNKNTQYYKYYGGKGIKCLITEEELKELWFRDKAYDMEKPSIDRKKSNKDYIFDNCQFIEQSLNSKKDNFKIILQYDLNGKFIREWESIKEASGGLKINSSNISSCAKRNLKQSKGFIWRYKT